MNYKIKASTLNIVLLLIPFFELYSINSFIRINYFSGFFYSVDRLLAIMRWGITAWIFVDTIIAKRRLGSVAKLIAIYSALRVVACYFNGSISVGIVVGNITNLGFALLAEKYLTRKPLEFINAARILFGMTCAIGVATILVFPHGFFNSSDKADAIYLFGSKNSGFYYYILFLFFGILYSFLESNKKYLKYLTVYSMIFCIASIATASANSLACILIVTIYLLGYSLVEKTVRIFTPRNIIMMIIILGALFLFGKDVPFINGIVGFFGRDLTFTGRDYIWTLSMHDFLNHVLWGCGVDYYVMLPNGIAANHAHNFFLDNLVKYGIIEFASLFALVLAVGSIIKSKIEKKIIIFYSTILFVVLLHSLLDDNSIYFICILFMTMQYIGEQKEIMSMTRIKKLSIAS